VPRSGYNEENYVEETLKLYKDEMSEDFPFLSVWNYLKDKPKWTVNMMKKKEVTKKAIVEKKPLAPAMTNGNVCSEDVVNLVDCLVGGDEDCAARPIGQKKAKQLRDAAQRQFDIDEKAAQAMQSRAETHKLQLEFKVFSSMGDAEEAKEWKTLVAQQFLLDRKKVNNDKKRAAEAEEEPLKKKREQKERLQKEIARFTLTMTKRRNRLLGTSAACARVFATRLVANTMAH
jgi:hypothetical protein